MRIETLLREQAARMPQATALVAGGTRLRYSDLDALSERFAASLAARGVARGDRVVLFMDNCWEMAVAVFAVLKAGAVVCPLNPGVKAAGLAHVLGDCQPGAIVLGARHHALLQEADPDGTLAGTRIIARAGESLPTGAVALEACLEEPRRLDREAGDENDLALIIYTSGSTGRAKGVMMAHRNVDAASRLIRDYLANTPDDVVLSVLPLSFTYGLYQLLVAVRAGACLVLEKSFAFPQTVLETARAEGVTGFPLVPTIAAMLVSMKDSPAGFLPDLRYMTNAAAALPPAHLASLRALFPKAELYAMYGLTECARATFLPPGEIDRHPGSVGKALPETEAFVVGEDGAPLAAGVTGELVVRGPHVMRGYWNDPAATDAVLRALPDGRGIALHTGDLFSTDAEGYLHFVGRRDDIIKVRGEKVPPRQVEDVLQSCPGVREALVFGEPEPVLGHIVHALVIRDDDALTEQAVMQFCARRLPDAMLPKKVTFRSELPRTASGKISRRLAAMEAIQAS